MSARTKKVPAQPKPRPASEAVKALTAKLMQDIGTQVNTLSALALRDAHLDPAEGWRYDPQRCVYVQESA